MLTNLSGRPSLHNAACRPASTLASRPFPYVCSDVICRKSNRLVGEKSKKSLTRRAINLQDHKLSLGRDTKPFKKLPTPSELLTTRLHENHQGPLFVNWCTVRTPGFINHAKTSPRRKSGGLYIVRNYRGIPLLVAPTSTKRGRSPLSPASLHMYFGGDSD